MPVCKFSSAVDANLYRKYSCEKHRLYYKPRAWLVHNTTVPLNIYGEPGIEITGTDGVTSTSSSRSFGSILVNFVTSHVGIGDILEIFKCGSDVDLDNKDDTEENGRYIIETVSTHYVIVDRNWPVGNKSQLKFSIKIDQERYTQFSQPVPFLVKLNPPKDELLKWGIEEQRDAQIVMSSYLCELIGLTPKIGDRFIYQYDTRNIHYEVVDLNEMDTVADSGLSIHLIGFCKRIEDVETIAT
jgi:hypothetical protein